MKLQGKAGEGREGLNARGLGNETLRMGRRLGWTSSQMQTLYQVLEHLLEVLYSCTVTCIFHPLLHPLLKITAYLFPVLHFAIGT